MTAPARPDPGQFDAMDNALLEIAADVGRLHQRVVGLAAAVAGLKVAQQAGGVASVPAPAPARERHLRPVRSAP